jgi:hypothetical protein
MTHACTTRSRTDARKVASACRGGDRRPGIILPHRSSTGMAHACTTSLEPTSESGFGTQVAIAGRIISFVLASDPVIQAWHMHAQQALYRTLSYIRCRYQISRYIRRVEQHHAWSHANHPCHIRFHLYQMKISPQLDLMYQDHPGSFVSAGRQLPTVTGRTMFWWRCACDLKKVASRRGGDRRPKYPLRARIRDRRSRLARELASYLLSGSGCQLAATRPDT